MQNFKMKKILAEVLSASMILTSFAVPTMAAEAEDVVEETAIVEESAAEEDLVDLTVGDEDVVGDTTFVLDNTTNMDALFTLMEAYDTASPASTYTDANATDAQDEDGTAFTSCVAFNNGISDKEDGKNGIKINFETGKTYDLVLYSWYSNKDAKVGAVSIVSDKSRTPVKD
ncbi:MAG: hypothetical protein IKR56_07545, partial [Lachnospiraceae bacterium]|nr:hypothetical protein [Lachnospiraceae bacterium]